MAGTSFKQRLRSILRIAFIVGAFLVFADLLLGPIYRRWLTDVPMLGAAAAYLMALAAALELPARAVLSIVNAQTEHHLTWGRWTAAIVVSAIAYTGGLLMLAHLWRWTRSHRGMGCQPVQTSLQPVPAAFATEDSAKRQAKRETTATRRQLLNVAVRSGVAVAGAAALGVGGWSMLVEPRRFEVSRWRIPIRGLDPALEGLRIVQLTDLHHSAWIPLTYLRSALQAANDAKPDLIVLTGDYVRQSIAYIKPMVEAFDMLRANIGIVATLGNHDWWEDGKITQREFARVGIPLIDNARRFITPDRALVERSDRGLCVAGVGDYWEDTQNYAAALGDVREEMPRLLLSHNPDVAEDATFLAYCAGGMRVDLMLSGHTHGGQISFPRIGAPLVPSRYGNKYLGGIVQGPACRVFVCRGVGLAGVPFRFRVRPEIAVIELTRAES